MTPTEYPYIIPGLWPLVVPIDTVHLDPANPKTGHDVKTLAALLQQFKQRKAIVVNRSDGCRIEAGNGTYQAAVSLGWEYIAVVFVDDDPQLAAAFAVADNRSAELSRWDPDALHAKLKAAGQNATGFTRVDISKLRSVSEKKDKKGRDQAAKVDQRKELLKKWGVKKGDLWHMGSHRLFCGDCTDPVAVAHLLQGGGCDWIMADPPYCSGGFQEAGKAAGSIGTRGDDMIQNDTLSTRGYIALMKAMFSLAGAGGAYVFTDWRMWVNLFDVTESSGFGVRNMIVWDKGTPGMGRGWRSQHELIMASMKTTQPFDPHSAQGNVIQCKRTGNKLHPTEKPVELYEKVLEVTDLAKIIYDPFCGSGTSIIAADNLDRQCLALDSDPAFVAVTLQRWFDLTGVAPTK